MRTVGLLTSGVRVFVAMVAAGMLLAGTTAKAAEWIPLFDGKSLAGWKAYGTSEPPASGWSVVDGQLYCDGARPRVDIITTKSYGNYELEVEWKMNPDGNSGLFFHADESTPRLPFNAPEIQLHAPGERELTPEHSAGALYELYPAKPESIRPAGEWNTTRVVARGSELEIWHNGVQVCKATIGSDEWKAKIAASKFADSPQFGTRTSGRIGLQNHGDPLWVRSIRLRPLD